MTEPIRILGICGSMRRTSYNAGLLRAAADLLPDGVELAFCSIAGLPMFNDDLLQVGPPESVLELKASIAISDALLFATPEYNYSLPGVLKNAIDWASRPVATSPLSGKPVGMMGASTGPFGTVRAQLHLRQVCVFTNMLPLNKPELMVARAAEKFDSEGNLNDTATRARLRDLLAALATWTRRLGSS
jgi:chromate reductase, NAD(P)H dehydrogenase (quinone)